MASIFGFEIRNIVNFQGREGYGCQGDIYHNGKKVGWYNDMADGGIADIDFWQNGKRNQSAQDAFDKAVKDYFEKFPLTGLMKGIEPDGELFMSALVELTEQEAKYKFYLQTGRKYFVTYENEQGFEVTCLASSDPQLYQKTKADKKAFNVKEYKSLSDFIIR